MKKTRAPHNLTTFQQKELAKQIGNLLERTYKSALSNRIIQGLRRKSKNKPA